MKAITLHPTTAGGSQQQYDQGYSNNNESRDRRSSTTNNPDYLNSHTNPATGTAVTSGGISGMGNIDATVNHYELPNLAQRKLIILNFNYH